MKQNHCPLSQNLRMAAAALTATSVMASKVFRPVIRAGVAAAVILAALIAAVVTGKKIADRRRSPWKSAPDASGSENQVEHPLLTFLFRQFNKPFHPLNRYKNPLYRFFISIYHKKYHFLLSNTTTQNCLFPKSCFSAVSFLNSLH